MERFEFIRQLGNIFLVRPEILRSYITEGYLGRIDPGLLKPYLAQRSDWSQLEKSFNDINVDGEDLATEASVRGLRDRLKLTRVSVMMKELEGLKLGEGMTMSIPTNIAGGFAIAARGLGVGSNSN